MNLFEVAVRNKFRFPTTKGELTIEQVLDLPLVSRSGTDLDTVAKGVNRELKDLSEESFVAKPTPRKAQLEAMLELLKQVIAERVAENEARVQAVQRQQEIAQLEALLDQRKAQELMELPASEIEARLAALRG